MLVKQLEDHFGVKAERSFTRGQHNIFQSGTNAYVFVPVSYDVEQLTELQHLVEFLRTRGDLSVAEFVPATSGSLLAHIDHEKGVLLKYPIRSYRRNLNIPKELALFHKRGRGFPQRVTKINRIGQWKFLWERRLDQMEIFWREKIQQQPQNDFEKMFIHSFPYYIGLSENAIQYLADTELDAMPQMVDSATICHSRFTGKLFRNGVKFPTDWLFDHCSRDLAEWVRAAYLRKKELNMAEIQHFLENYVTVTPLSPFSWRLMYARLLFPIHYFECIEEYYINEGHGKEQEYVKRLNRIVGKSNEYEQFAAHIPDLLTPLLRQQKIPEIPWLKKCDILTFSKNNMLRY